MPAISEITIENVRCFSSKQHARLGRITVLVGENSVGKSTFLGCYNAFANLSNLTGLEKANPFDVTPFSMGTYETIARTGASGFTVTGRYTDHVFSEARFAFACDEVGQPFEECVAFEFSGADATSRRIKVFTNNGDEAERTQVCFDGPNFKFKIDWAELSYVPITTWLSRNVRQGFLPYGADRATFEKRFGSAVTYEEIVEFYKFVNFFRSEMPLPAEPSFVVRAIDPNVPPRQRRYKELANYFIQAVNNDQINNVGARLGLWQTIVLNETALDDSTEVIVSMEEGSHNMIDVGYGVHSLLPVVCSIADENAPSTFLLQQPEVHVHPVAQAKLAEYMANTRHSYMIETHSDHLVDRLRICVRKGSLSPEDLVILFFESSEDHSGTKIHNISIDEEGNVVNPPDSYREFFLDETEKLLGLK